MKREVHKVERFFIMFSALGLFTLAGLPFEQPLKAMAGGQQATINHPTVWSGEIGDKSGGRVE